MADLVESSTRGGDDCMGTQSMDSIEGKAELCSNCHEAIGWIYGEDCMPVSLSCGHTICFKCARTQWSSPGTQELMVYCVSCSIHVPITSCKSLLSSENENTPTKSIVVEKCEAGMDNNDACGVEPLQNTPTHLCSTTEFIQQQQGSEGKQTNYVGYSMDRVTSALSSPLVLDKIQSQDDAWRLLQHDEGFIRDWIVANVPDHVIFKMVGAGNTDGSIDSGTFVVNNTNTVIIPSPPKTEEVASTAPVTVVAGSMSLAGGSSGQEENGSRASFEQQFLQYLVSKATPQGKLPVTEDVHKEQGLPGSQTTVDSAAQTTLDHVMEESGEMELSTGSHNKAASVEIMIQGLNHVQSGQVGNEGDCSVIGKDSSQMSSGSMPTDGEASQLAVEFQSHSSQTASDENVMTEINQYDSGPSVLPSQPATFSSYIPSVSMAYQSASSQNMYQQNPDPHMFATVSGGTGRFSSFPAERNMDSGPHGTYGSYPYPCTQQSYYSWHKQYGQPYGRMPHPGSFGRFPHYAPHRGGHFGRERSMVFPSPFRTTSESSWSSKACTMVLNPPSQNSLPSLPQIRFVQVLRTKPDQLGVSELPRMEGDAAALSGKVAEEVVEKETPVTESQKEAEAEVALMKTRDMPHGTQVEDIYVVPQVWLTGGRDSVPVDSSQQNSYPYPKDSPLGSPSNPLLGVSSSALDQGLTCPSVQRLSPGKARFAENYSCEQPNSSATTGFAGSELSLLSKEQATETSGMLRASEVMANSLTENVEEKNATDDCIDYTNFKPVAVVTTVSAGKTTMTVEHEAEMTAAEISDLTHPSLINSITTTPLASSTGAFDQGQATETPVRDIALMTSDILGNGGIGQVPAAPVKKTDRNFEPKLSSQVPPLRQNIVDLSHQKAENSARALAATGYAAEQCNKTVQDAAACELTRRELETQTSALGSEVQILEKISSQPSAIILPRQDAPEVPQSRKRLRRNLSSEFYNSDKGIGGSYYSNQRPEARDCNRSGRLYPSKYGMYSSGFGIPQQARYPHSYPYNYGPRPYYYAQNAPLNYRQPHPYREFLSMASSEKPGDYQYGMPLDEVRQPGTMYSMLHRPATCPPAWYPYASRPQYSGPPASQSYPSPLSQPYTDVLGHLSSGRGDYSNTSSVIAQTKPQQDYQQRGAMEEKRGLGCGSEQNGATGDGAYSSGRDWRRMHHRVPIQDLDTVHWIQKEVRELNKEMNSNMLSRLETCLALLEKSTFHHPSTSPFSSSTTFLPQVGGSTSSQRDMRDMDHLWRCILTLGKVVVQYGWWVRPHHHWDGSSERWAEMAMLASSIFTYSLHSLTEVITFYMDHCTASVGAPQDSLSDLRTGQLLSSGSSPRLVDQSASLDFGEGQNQAGTAQYTSMLPKGQMLRRVGQLGSSSTVVDSSKPHISVSLQQQRYSSATLQNQIHTVSVDPAGSYLPCPSAFNKCEEDDSPLVRNTDMYTSGASRPQANFAVGDCALANPEREVTPSVVYHYKVADISKVPEQGRRAYTDGVVDASSQGIPEKVGYTPGESGQLIPVQCSGPAEVETPALAEDASPDLVSADQPAIDTASGLAVDQTHIEVYYTMEGAVLNEISPDSHLLTAVQAPGDEDSMYAGNIMYTVSQLTETDSSGGMCTEDTVSYIISADVENLQQSLTQADIPMKTQPSNPSDSASPPTLTLPDSNQTTTTEAELAPLGEGSLQPDQPQDSSNSITAAEETDSFETDVTQVETVFQPDQPDMSLYTVMMPAQKEDSGSNFICPDQEVISDAAIILSETVEVETDISLEMTASKDESKPSPVQESLPGQSAPQAEDGRMDQKGNVECTPYSGKRKHAGAAHLKNKRSKLDVWCEKQPPKGTPSTKGGKWNLRSSRGSV